MKFGTQLEHAIRNIFGYRAIADLSRSDRGGHYLENGRQMAIILQMQVLDHLGS